ASRRLSARRTGPHPPAVEAPQGARMGEMPAIHIAQALSERAETVAELADRTVRRVEPAIAIQARVLDRRIGFLARDPAPASRQSRQAAEQPCWQPGKWPRFPASGPSQLHHE